MCLWFGAAPFAAAAPVSAVDALGCAGATAAAESHGEGEDGVGVEGAARQDGRAVLHLVVSAERLKGLAQEPLVAVPREAKSFTDSRVHSNTVVTLWFLHIHGEFCG